MKNLKLLYQTHKCYDIQNKVITNVNLHPLDEIYGLSCGKQIFIVSNSKKSKILNFNNEEIIDFEFQLFSNKICVATTDGSVFMSSFNDENVEEVTYCADGIEVMKFSPDAEIVVFLSKTKSLVVMNCEFDVLSETSLLDTSFGEQEFITAGWGKKETQFQGLGGKQIAQSEKDSAAQQKFIEHEQSAISWREDGEFFAVLFTHGTKGQMFKVFSKEGVLQYTSDHTCCNLGATLSWRPSGNWIAVPQVFHNKYVIALFEKNGLRHHEVLLPFSVENERVTNLSWSNDSEILLVQTLGVKDDVSLYLFTTSNYYWSLKQFMNFTKSACIQTKWDQSTGNLKTLHVFSNSGKQSLYVWEKVINCSYDEESVVAMIDGTHLSLTCFRHSIVPPPMQNIKISMKNFINFVTFPSNGEQNQLLVIDGLNQIHIHKYEFSNEKPRRLIEAKKMNTYCFKANPEITLGIFNFVWLHDTICFLDDKHIYFAKFADGHEILVSKVLEQNGIFGSLFAVGNYIFGQNVDGVVMKTKVNEIQELQDCFKVQEFCTKIEVSQTGDFVVLQKRNNLYINNVRVTDAATSFKIVDNNYAIYTTIDELKFIDISTTETIDVRKIERGSEVVARVLNTSRVIMQMPRGNLECISPRFLSLIIVNSMLETQRYREAFEILRKERINLNVIVDHNPDAFLKNANIFIKSISNVQWLNLFVSDLQNVDVTINMYANSYRNEKRNYSANYTIENKIHLICDCLIEILEKNEKYLLTILTCQVKKGDLERALDLVWKLKIKSENILNEHDTASPSPDDAFKYLLYLVDVNDLYCVALGMYDFSLVLFVAKRSQKDPKEYIPFLQELERLEEHYRKFKIDCHLKRYQKAVNHISKCNGDEYMQESLKLIKEHKLYSEALSAYKHKPNCYEKVALTYADYLREKNKLPEASIMYERAADIVSAINCARNTLDWKRCVVLMKKAGNSDEEINLMCEKIVKSIAEAGNYKEAATIYKTILFDSTKAIQLLLTGNLYSDAIFESSLASVDLLSTIVEHLSNYIVTITNSFRKDLELFMTQSNRLKTIRNEKQKQKIDTNFEEDALETDGFSDTSSMDSSKYSKSSRGSGKTFTSSKSRRKHERKLLNMKEGNKFEDLALINSLHKIATKAYSLEQQNHVKSILIVALKTNCEQIAKELQKSYSQLLIKMKEEENEIWIKQMIVPDDITLQDSIGFSTYQACQHYSLINPQQRYKPELVKIEWELESLK